MASTTFTDNITPIAASWLNDVNSATYTILGNGTSYTGVLTLAGTTDSTSTTTGMIINAGGAGIAKALWVGGLANIAGAVTLQNDLAVNGGDLTTSATTFNLLNATATTVNFAGGASTALNIGNASGTNTVLGATTFSQGVTLSSALTYGGVALSNAVTGTGNMMLSASPTTTGTLTAAAINASGRVTSEDTYTGQLNFNNGSTADIVNRTGTGLDFYVNGSTVLTRVAQLTGTGLSVTGTLGVTGVLTVSAGSVSAPSISSATGTADCGIYFPGTDIVAIATSGTQRFQVTLAGYVKASPDPTALLNATSAYHEMAQNSDTADALRVRANHASYTGTAYYCYIDRAFSTAYKMMDLTSSSGSAFTVLGNGDTTIAGSLSKGSGTFRISHPLPALTETHQLVHSFIEGPQADLIYRGRIALVNGLATVNIDEASGMTDGTFEVLCRDVQCFTSNETDFHHVRGSVSGNVLTIECEDNTCTSTISWMVIGERKDQHMYDTGWTDDEGRPIVEPLKPVEPAQASA